MLLTIPLSRFDPEWHAVTVEDTHRHTYAERLEMHDAMMMTRAIDPSAPYLLLQDS